MANAASADSVSTEELTRQLENCHKRPDGGLLRKRPYAELSDAEKFNNIDIRLNSLIKDANQNSFRIYSVQKILDKVWSQEELNQGAQPRKLFLHEVLEQIFVKALGISEELAKTMSTSGLLDIYRFRESGANRLYCMVFRLNRTDLCGNIYKNLGKLANFENPFGQRSLTISKNLSDEENKERQCCLAVKDVLKSKGFDPKIKKNVFISVNRAEARHYSMFLSDQGNQVSRKRLRLDEGSSPSSTPLASGVSDQQGTSSSQSGPPPSKTLNLTGSEFPPLAGQNTDKQLTPEEIAKFKAFVASN